MNVYNFATDPNLKNTTLTINGSASGEQFVFVLSGGLSLTNVNIVLGSNVSASNVFFVITGGKVSISGSNISGTILDGAGSGGSISLSGDVIHGGVISDTGITISSSVFAPELPTIMMAGLACFAAVAGKAGFRRLRRRIPTGDPALPQT